VTLDYNGYLVSLLVLTRLTGALLFNPFLGRRSVPAIAKIGLALLLTVVIFPTLKLTEITFPTPLSFMLSIIRELLIGYALGLVVNLFIAWALMAGEIMDMEMGSSVSKIYDPQSGISMPITGTALNILFTLIFFSTNGHLTLIKIVAASLTMFPPGPNMVAFEVGQYLTMMLGDMIMLALKLAMPVLAIELLSEAGLGPDADRAADQRVRGGHPDQAGHRPRRGGAGTAGDHPPDRLLAGPDVRGDAKEHPDDAGRGLNPQRAREVNPWTTAQKPNAQRPEKRKTSEKKATSSKVRT
jgi:flagellar biosynthetic protein FliR